MEDKLTNIISLIQKFNQTDYKFELELRIVNKEKRVFLKPERIMELVCRESGLTPEYVNMKTRERKIVLYRQMCHYLAAKNTKMSLAQIGLYFGGKDHATVLYSINTIESLINTDKEFREKYGYLLNQGKELVEL